MQKQGDGRGVTAVAASAGEWGHCLDRGATAHTLFTGTSEA